MSYVLLTFVGSRVAPKNVTATNRNSTFINVTWINTLLPCRLINIYIAGFRVQYAAQPDGKKQMKDMYIDTFTFERILGTNTSYSLTELTPYTKYSIQIALLSAIGDVGVYSDPVMAQTDEDSKLNYSMLILLFFSSLAPGPVVLVPHPSLVKISITWDKPAMPNGIITHYEVFYGRYDLVPSHNKTVNVTSTSFTTPDHLELGTERIFTVRAYTRVGGGEPTTLTVSTLTRPRE